MAFGFHLLAIGARSVDEVWMLVDEVAKGSRFMSRVAICHGVPHHCYRASDRHPEIPVALDFQPDRCQVSAYPLGEAEVSAYGPEILVQFFSGISMGLGASLGRTFLDIGYGTVQTSEMDGALSFVDWYQYFSPAICSRWGIDRLRAGPFFRVEEYANGSCGLWLAPSPFGGLGRTRAADYLGISLPKLYAKDPLTGEPIEMPWN